MSEKMALENTFLFFAIFNTPSAAR